MPSRRPTAFTLVEVLVATAVLAVGLLGALTAFSMAARVTGVSRHDTMVALLAQEKLADISLQAREQTLDPGETEGDFGEDYPGYSWRLMVGQSDDNNLKQVELAIRAPRSGREHETRFYTAVF